MQEDKAENIRGKILLDEKLAKYTWLQVGGKADRLYIPADVTDLQYFLRTNKGRDYFVLGGGSNVLIRDGGYSGTVIKLDAPEFKKISVKKNEIICGAGVLNFRLKNVLLKHAIGGLEFLCTVPGTIGGALIGNAGCFGKEIAAVLKWARIMSSDGEIAVLSKQELGFSYRQSCLPPKSIVLEVCLGGESASSQDIEQEIKRQTEYRRTHQPQGILTAGSTFKNPTGFKAWELIKNSGAADLVVGGARMSPQHCNFLQNNGSATAADIEELGKQIIDRVAKNSGVELQWEVKIIGNK